jgi:ectoine hydroxylase-related dioxygenase (phytanoyl-CoA dioxygenase family)
MECGSDRCRFGQATSVAAHRPERSISEEALPLRDGVRACGAISPLQSRVMAQSGVMEQSRSAASDSPVIRERFERDGWVLVPRLLTPREVEALRSASDAVAAKGAHLWANAEIDGARYEVQTASGRRGESAICEGALRKITFASSASEEIGLLRNDRRVLKLMESVGVTSPRWIVDQINLKAPMVGTGFPWHQDAAFVAWQQRDAIAQYGGANLVIALDRADELNGGFEVLTGTHAGGVANFDYDTSVTNAGVFDESGRTLIPLDPGDAVVFHPHLAHGSGPNPSPLQRRLVALWFIGAPAITPRRALKDSAAK